MHLIQEKSAHLLYRPDIDGLRAFAVASVVMFHAFPDLLPGGFIGVDVFFVISGFLISSILFKEIDRGSFTLRDFYSRRIKRIFPTLAIVLIATYFVGWFVLFSDEFKVLGGHVAAGAGFFSNIALWRQAGYFDSSSDVKLLLHLWSLGIEEQFYIVWPLIVGFVLWRRKAGWIFLALALSSFFVGLYQLSFDPVGAFYSPLTRFWEMICGGLLAQWQRVLKGHDAGVASDFLGFAGFILFGLSIAIVDKHSVFPGWLALLPVSSALCLIAAGPHARFNKYVLANPILVWLGLISYPLYLWHWPLLTYLRILGNGMAPVVSKLFVVIFAVVLSWITYRYVERPFRRIEFGKSKLIPLVLVVATIGILGFVTGRANGLPFRSVETLSVGPATGFDGGAVRALIRDCGLDDVQTKKLFALCEQDSVGPVKYALIGDSKAGSLWRGLVRTSMDNGRWLAIGGNGPHGAPVPLLVSADDESRPLTSAALRAIVANQAIEKVVIAASARALFDLKSVTVNGNLANYDHTYFRQLSSFTDYGRVYDQFGFFVSQLVAGGKNVILLVDNPALPEPQDCVVRRTLFESINYLMMPKKLDCELQVLDFSQEISIYRKLLDEVASKHRGRVVVFDATDIYCPRLVCGPSRDGRVLYSGTDHISDFAAGLVGERLNRFLAEPK
jgi:peptidoglycan/LPS O-acetylase OafA/YrhL